MVCVQCSCVCLGQYHLRIHSKLYLFWNESVRVVQIAINRCNLCLTYTQKSELYIVCIEFADTERQTKAVGFVVLKIMFGSLNFSKVHELIVVATWDLITLFDLSHYIRSHYFEQSLFIELGLTYYDWETLRWRVFTSCRIGDICSWAETGTTLLLTSFSSISRTGNKNNYFSLQTLRFIKRVPFW